MLDDVPLAPVSFGVSRTLVSPADASGRAGLRQFQQLDGRLYFDDACRVVSAEQGVRTAQHRRCD